MHRKFFQSTYCAHAQVINTLYTSSLQSSKKREIPIISIAYHIFSGWGSSVPRAINITRLRDDMNAHKPETAHIEQSTRVHSPQTRSLQCAIQSALRSSHQILHGISTNTPDALTPTTHEAVPVNPNSRTPRRSTLPVRTGKRQTFWCYDTLVKMRTATRSTG